MSVPVIDDSRSRYLRCPGSNWSVLRLLGLFVLPPMRLAPNRHALSPSASRELSIHTQAIRQPTLAACSAGHAIDRPRQLEATSHLCTVRPAEVSQHAPGVMRDVLELRTHVIPALLMPGPCGPSSSVKLLVIWKNRPLKVSPFAKVAVMEPDTMLGLLQLNFTKFVPGTVEPEPVLIVAQPATTPTTSRNAVLKIMPAILNLRWLTSPCRI